MVIEIRRVDTAEGIGFLLFSTRGRIWDKMFLTKLIIIKRVVYFVDLQKRLAALFLTNLEEIYLTLLQTFKTSEKFTGPFNRFSKLLWCIHIGCLRDRHRDRNRDRNYVVCFTLHRDQDLSQVLKIIFFV